MLLAIKLVLAEETINIINTNAPQVGLEECIETNFFEDMDELMRGLPKSESFFFKTRLKRTCGEG